MQPMIDRHRGRGETIMNAFNGRNTGWAAVALLLALLAGPMPALAGGVKSDVGLVLYEVTEDMYLLDSNDVPTGSLQHAIRRSAVAQLFGTAKLGTPLCPWEVLQLAPGTKSCTVSASGADHLSLADGKGTLGGTFAVTVQGDNNVDAPEFVVMTGRFHGAADLSLPFAGIAPIGYLTHGHGSIDGGAKFTFTGTFRLPFAVDKKLHKVKPRKNGHNYYLADDFSSFVPIEARERSLDWPTVRLEIKF
jgi:hypothetical protein